MDTERIISWTDYVDSTDEYCIPTWIDGGERWSYPLHQHEGQAEAMALLEGSLRHRVNGKIKTLVQGDAVFVSMNDVHSLAACATRVRLINLAFPSSAPSLISSLGSGTAYDSGFTVNLPQAELKRFIEYADGFVDNGTDKTTGNPGKALLAEFLLWLARTKDSRPVPPTHAESDAPIPAGSRPPPWFSNLVAWSELPGKAPPPLRELVERSGRTEEHLCRCFRRFLGVSPGAFLVSLRIRRAKDLLAHSNWSLQDICYASGFESPSRFYASFNSLEGLPPGRYRAVKSRNPYAEKT